ncbi:MAG: TIGR01459 family HAD-type hydrolase [Bacteroidota bacterium]
MDISSFLEIAEPYKVIFLDSYGVVKNHRGLIVGADQIIAQLRSQGKVVRILTNDASRSPQRQAEKFKKLGFEDIAGDEIITSGMMARQFLEDKSISGKVAYLGTQASAQYILHANREAISVSQIDLDDSDDIGAFVFLDDEGFDWNFDINTTINLLRRRNIPVIVANSDKLYPVAKNDVAVATGGIAQLVESILNRQFIHFGKPDAQMFIYAFGRIQQVGDFKKTDILMVGDTLHTDILGGNKFGISTALVLTGNTPITHVDNMITATGILPDYICSSIVS